VLRFLADENFNGDIVRGLLRRQPDLDLVRVQDVALPTYDDPGVLTWAAQHQRIVLTHDRATMPDYAYARLGSGAPMPGVFIFNDRFPVGDAIAELLWIASCSEAGDWDGRVVYLPL